MEVISEECGDSPKQVQRYLKLTKLIPELLEKVDDGTMGFTIKILNPESIDQAEKMMVCAARLTQRGHQISCLSDFMDLYEKTYQRSTVANLVKLPHPTIQKFGISNVVIVGAFRRFLAQITRHQNEVQYGNEKLPEDDCCRS